MNFTFLSDTLFWAIHAI